MSVSDNAPGHLSQQGNAGSDQSSRRTGILGDALRPWRLHHVGHSKPETVSVVGTLAAPVFPRKQIRHRSDGMYRKQRRIGIAKIDWCQSSERGTSSCDLACPQWQGLLENKTREG